MKKSIRKRVISGLLAGLMIFSNINIATDAADTGYVWNDGTEDEILEEDGAKAASAEQQQDTAAATDAGTIRIEKIETVSSDEKEQTSDTADAAPADLGAEAGRAELSLANWWYQDAEGNRVSADTSTTTVDGTATEVCDLSGAEGEAQTYVGFDLVFTIRKDVAGDMAQAQDYLQVALPSGLSDLTVTPQERGSYTVRTDGSGRLTITLLQTPEGEQLTGTVPVTFSVTGQTTFTLQTSGSSRRYQIAFPKPADGTADASKDTMTEETGDAAEAGTTDALESEMAADANAAEDEMAAGTEDVSKPETAADANAAENNMAAGTADASEPEIAADANAAENNMAAGTADASEAETTADTDDTENETAAQTEEALLDEAALQQADADGQEADMAAEPETDGQEAADAAVVNGVFQISGTITYNEIAGGTDWRSLVRPAVFDTDHTIKITQTYTDSKGEVHTTVFDAQEDLSQQAFYLKFVHNGEGGGDFVIENVPKSVVDAYGVPCQVTDYSVDVEPKLPYYNSTTPITISMDHPENITAALGTLTIGLKTQTLTLHPAVTPDGTDNPAFLMDAAFTNPNLKAGEAETGGTMNATYRPTENTATTVQVPVGISYEVIQKKNDGYRFGGNYTTTVTTTKDGTTTSTSTTDTSAKGTIEAGSNVEISTVNYAQNVSVGFDVEWLDNNRATRPELSAENFVLQYRTAGGEWKELTSNDYKALGLTKAPVFDVSKAASNQYAYTGLPAADAEGNALEYQVVVKKNPDGYVSYATDESGRRKFIFEEQTSFHATIEWRDKHRDKTQDTDSRPGTEEIQESLKLYRRVGNGTYELVQDALAGGTITQNQDDTWSVDLSGLPRYNGENQEYDYVLVQGSINANGTVTQTPPEHYRTYYDNGTGSYGNDTALCHNNGTIKEVLYSEVDFQANKVWQDPAGTEADRPTATVTLWRYVKGTAENIDDAYQKGVAAQVVFQTQTNGTVEENIVAYQLNKAQGTAEDPQAIAFTSATVSNLPEGYAFPAYDDHGQEYVYFVRESLSGTYADEFEIQYTTTTTDADGKAHTETYQNGVPADGTITNVRRKKEAVNVTKLWQNQSGLDGIENVSVRTTIKASADGGNTYDELTVYSDAAGSYEKLTGEAKEQAQTITGFAANLPQSEGSYYVNTCDREGRPYDMKHAQITEEVVVTNADGTTTVYKTGTDEEGRTTITIDGQTYLVDASYESEAVLGDGVKQYRYRLTNTITASRDYTLIKEWDKSISEEEIAGIQTVNFRLERRSSKDKADGTTADYEVVQNGTGETASELWTVDTQAGRTWTNVLKNLPRYDSEGYEYYYRATEVSFTTKNGETISLADANAQYKWGAEHYRTPDQTRVVNYKTTGEGRSYFTVSKLWQDNGDTASRKTVRVRVYRRAELRAALEALGKDASITADTAVDLDQQLSDVKHYDTTLTNDGQYTAFINYADLDKALEKTEGADRFLNYVVLEYMVGEVEADGATPAQYTFGQLMAAASSTGTYSLSGTVENAKRSYRTTTTVDETSRLALLTNTRTGTTSIHAEKTWNDENNASSLRPQTIQFQLYQNGAAYTGIPETVTIEADANSSADTAGDGTQEAEDGTSSADAAGASAEGAAAGSGYTVELDHKTGIITVTGSAEQNTAAKWAFTIRGLDMFSSTAVPHTYNIDERPADVDGTKHYSYIQKKVNTTITDADKSQTCSFAFANTITGTIDHIAYKYWKDASIGASHRPDLYMNLYRYLKKDLREAQETNPDATAADLPADKLSLYTGYKDQIWTAEPKQPAGSDTPTAGSSAQSDYEQGYNWKITVEDLPRFDADGNEYGYVFKEVMNNGGRTVLGTYVPSAETKKVPSDSNSADADTYEVFTNTITDYMTVHGQKTWSGFTGYQIKESDLPDPLITLYRTTDAAITDLQSKSDDDIRTLLSSKTIEKVDTTRLTGSKEGGNDRTRYAFPDANVTEEELSQGLICKVLVNDEDTCMLPKFDENGRRYTYLVRETFEDSVVDGLYSEINQNGTLQNVFRSDVNRRSITVTKSWDGRAELKDGEKKYPSVTYTLYRYEPKLAEDGTLTWKEEPTQIATHTIKASEFTGTNGSASYTFTDLLIYSPDGAQYCYYIKETAINGYTVSYTDEPDITAENSPLINQTIRTGKAADGTAEGITITEKMLQNLAGNDRIDVISLPANWDGSASGKDEAKSSLTVSVGTTNTYNNPGKVQISGQKQWDDYGDSEGLRPDTIHVTLRRRTANETGQNNKIDDVEVPLEVKASEDKNTATPYIVWNKGTSDEDSKTAATWSYTIYNLERYAPNGMPYIYTLSEEQVKGYQQANTVTGQPNAGETIRLSNLTNRFAGSYYVRKNWMDGSNKYNLRPNSITVKLQRSTDGETWNDIPWQESYGTYNAQTKKWTGLPSVMSGTDGTPIVSITLNADYAIKNTRNNSWEYTFTNLPTQDKAGNTYTYRCVETAIGGVPLQANAAEDGTTKYTAGAYECRYTTQDASRTVIENTLDSTSLVVTKKWEGDQDNRYQSRPDKLTFVLQKRSVLAQRETEGEAASAGEPGEWHDVLNADGTPYTFTIGAGENWTKTLEDLPTVEVVTGEDGTTYTAYSLYFRAVEVHADDTNVDGKVIYATGKTAAGAKNYKDRTDYSTNSKDHVYNQDLRRNESTITNELIQDTQAKTITVTKIWRRVAGASVSATFELLYKTAAGSEWKCYGENEIKSASGTDAEITAGTDWTKHTGADKDGKHCLLQTVSSTEATTTTVTWTDLPKYDRDGNELVYKVIEHPVAGYQTITTTQAQESGTASGAGSASNPSADGEATSAPASEEAAGSSSTAKYPTAYTFTNIELQSYTVRKIWQNTDYAEKTEKGYTATFQLQQRIGADGTWEAVSGRDSITLTSKTANDTAQEHTWNNLPKYTVDGTEITYRAVETQINGKDVTENTNGAYVVSYRYAGSSDGGDNGNSQGSDVTDASLGEAAAQATGKSDPEFGDTQTTATNRMIYGFVNLSKQAAYLAPAVIPAVTPGAGTSGGNQTLAGVTFHLYKVDAANSTLTGKETPYASNIKTDANGNLINDHGKYGDEQKYLISGTYVLKEISTLPEYSVWAKGVTFTVGSGNKAAGTETRIDTGEHGTAWISTDTTTLGGSIVLGLKVTYQQAVTGTADPVTNHTYQDSCHAYGSGDAAVNLESRGGLSFTKTGPETASGYTALDTHGSATGESSAYFGVYLDKECTQQVAGLVPKSTVVSGSDDKATMVLTDKAQDGTTALPVLKTKNNVPYLRAYNNQNTSDYPFTLLSGTYYIKELVAPAGYKLDTKLRKATIAKLESTALGEDLSAVYANNKATIVLLNTGTGAGASGTETTDYKWSNEPNVVKLYKMDQYGRKVPLSKNGYLELKVEGNGNTFPSGEQVIRLYQNPEKPATKADGTTAVGNISYDTNTGAWTITGLFDIGKTYTLLEPADSVHANYVVANQIQFSMNANGTIQLAGSGSTDSGNAGATASDAAQNTDAAAGSAAAGDIEKSDQPLKADGTNYKNSYQPDAGSNTIVMRDVARYLKDLALEKLDSSNDKPIANISFRLYKYDSKDASGTITGKTSVLEDNVYLTTDAKGMIRLEQAADSVKNQLTGCALKYGLDVGNYYFEEVERGASDQYRLIGEIYFAITPKADGSATDYSDRAEVDYDTSDSAHISVGSNGKTVTVKNDPVTNIAKTLELVKVDSTNTETKLSGARFLLTYQSINHGHGGSSTGGDKEDVLSWNCMTDTDGILYLADIKEDGSWEVRTNNGTKIKPDISAKGSYTLKEIQAPNGYMTRTTDGTTEVVTMLTFQVDSDNKIIDINCYTENGNLVTSQEPIISKDPSHPGEEHIQLNVTVKNEKTRVSIAKRNDIESGNGKTDTKTGNQKSLNGELLNGAALEIYEGVYTGKDDTGNTGSSARKVATLGNGQSEWSWIRPAGTNETTSDAELPAGTLKENTIYTLHESTAPIGYLAADDIYFKLSGTTTKQSGDTATVVSQLYVWTGSDKPTSVTEKGWSQTTNLNDNVLTMVDEAIIAPVDVQKVIGNGSYQALAGAVFEVKEKTGDTENLLGTAESTASGYLVWKDITDAGYSSRRIFNAEGKRISEENEESNHVIGSTIILQQNADGYTFTEVSAPDNAYNEGKTFTVKITAENYKAYRKHTTQTKDGVTSVTTTYDTTAYIDLLEANTPDGDGNCTYTVEELSHRNDTTNAATASDLINPPFEAAFQIYKYDAESSEINSAHNNYGKIGMAGVVFTLTKKQSDGTYKKVGDYTTGTDGLLSIAIAEKGTYQLKEARTLTGYRLSDKVMEFTIVNADYKKTLTYSEAGSGTGTTTNVNHTKVIKNADGAEVSGESTYDLPNSREHGTVTLTKQDANSEVKLNGVQYILTRTTPDINSNVDRYFPSNQVKSLTVETGKTYSNIAGATRGMTSDTAVSSGILVTAGADGVLTLQDLQWGTYKLVEQQEKDGYILDQKEFTFTIDGSHLAVSVTDTGKDWVENTKNQLTIKKVAASAEAKQLQGAEFSLYPVTENADGTLTMNTTPADFYASADATSKATTTTITAGETTIYGLAKGTYVLRETKAPDGYELAKDVIFDLSNMGVVSNVTTCTVAENQTITKDANGSAVVSLETSGSGISASNTLTIRDVPIEIYVQKLGEGESEDVLHGAEFVLKDACTSGSHALANGAESETITVNGNKILIPIERLIGGHTYTLTETKAPDGYECTAVVTFHVKTDGTVDQITSTGGYKGPDGKNACASVSADADTEQPMIRIRDEKIRMSLTKVDYENSSATLNGVTFTLTPYGTASDGTPSAFVANYNNTGLTYDEAKNTYTFVTRGNEADGTEGTITFPEGLLKHGNSYLLQETATAEGYYLGSEAKAGVILTVGKDGGITVTRLDAYKGKTEKKVDGKDISSCPVTAASNAAGNSDLIVTNRKATSFELTKKVDGNMGDQYGTFQIKMTVYEPDGTLVGERTVNLKTGEVYDSVTGIQKEGVAEKQAFGSNAIPVGATLVISEDNALNYTAVVRITSTDGKGTVLNEEQADKGTVKVRLDTSAKVSIELTNRKEVTLDVGVRTEHQAPLAAIALILPAIWLADRYRRKRKGGEASR